MPDVKYGFRSLRFRIVGLDGWLDRAWSQASMASIRPAGALPKLSDYVPASYLNLYHAVSYIAPVFDALSAPHPLIPATDPMRYLTQFLRAWAGGEFTAEGRPFGDPDLAEEYEPVPSGWADMDPPGLQLVSIYQNQLRALARVAMAIAAGYPEGEGPEPEPSQPPQNLTGLTFCDMPEGIIWRYEENAGDEPPTATPETNGAPLRPAASAAGVTARPPAKASPSDGTLDRRQADESGLMRAKPGKMKLRRDATRPEIARAISALAGSADWERSSDKERCRLVDRHLGKSEGWCKVRTLGRAISDHERGVPPG